MKLQDSITTVHLLVKMVFDHVDSDNMKTCQWFGTTYNAKGTLESCGEEAVGIGLFCDPNHDKCATRVVCQRHNIKTPWYGEEL